MTKRQLLIGAAFVGVLAVLAVVQGVMQQVAAAQAKNTVMAPRFEVDPFWPKPLPNGWVLGSSIGVDVDADDNIWMIHRGAPTLAFKESLAATGSGDCCKAAPPILQFDQAGNLLRSWGGPGPGYEWPMSNHGITVSSKGVVWIGGSGAEDGHIITFTKEGKFLKQFGFQYANSGSNDLWAFKRVPHIDLDETANEAYVADGYGNRRVAVIDMTTGKIKRYWGAYGNRPDDTDPGPYKAGMALSKPPQFRTSVHCAVKSNDGIVYVCDRVNNRVQWFTKEGKFIDERIVDPNTLGDGSFWEVDFSKDPEQKYLYQPDGSNNKLNIWDRKSMTLLTSFGGGGRQPGQWYAVHSLAVDSKGNIYTTETYEGKRIQKFVFKGEAPVTKPVQGVPWPTTQ